jgi:flagellar motor switch protein FliM
MSGSEFGGSEALTQKDIDQLLKKAAGGAAVSGKGRKGGVDVTPYNFLRPPRISKDRRIQLESIGGRFALSLQSMLSSRLRSPMDVTCTVEQVTMSEFVLSIANPCAAFVFELGGPEGGQAAIDISTDFSFFMVDRVFGGPGEPANLGRGLTPLERSVVRGFAEKILVLFREAWQDHLPLKPEIVGFESTPDMLQFAAREDNVLVVNLEVRIGEAASLMAMCLPLLALESFLAEKTTGRVPNRQISSAQRESVEVALRSAAVDLAVRFPPVRLSAREVAGLRVGQIIQTTQSTNGPIELHVNGTPRFLGVLGQYHRMLGLRITQAIGLMPQMTPGRARRGRISE